MRPPSLSLFGGLLALVSAQDEQTKHGENEEGSTMGPVAFLWPPDRTWNAANDNNGPCGSPNGPSNRTSFPLSQDNPTTQAEFDDQVVDNVTDIDPGHQCYKLDQLENIAAGTNATIQLEYWAAYEGENNGNNQSFFACADVTFVETTKFTEQVPCFNVTSEEFDAPTPTAATSGTPSATGSTSQGPSVEPASPSGGLSTGSKVGIAVGSVIGGLVLVGAVAFFVWRRGKTAGLKGKEEYELRAKNLNTPPAE